MPERRVKLPFGPVQVEGSEVPITNRNETVNEYQLEDGSTIRVATVVTQVIRLGGMFDADGNPVNIARNGVVTTTISAPQPLRRQ
jgi:hypothetical protein